MAAASTKKLEELLQCSICMLKLTNAKSFKCLHYFCQPCIKKLQPKLENNVYGYECPMCRQMTPEKELRNMHIIHDLIEVMDLATKEQSLCNQCKTEIAEHRCLDCKENMCAGCRAQHDKWSMARNHEWQEMSKEPKTIIDKHVFCPTHPKKLMELNCIDCNELICQLCNATKHKQHNAETIDDALKRLLPIVEKNKSCVLEGIKQNEDQLSFMKDSIIKIRKTYNAIDNKIDEEKQRAIKKIEEDAKLAKDQLAGFKKQQLCEAEASLSKMELHVKSQKNIVALTDTALSTAQGTSLLQAIETDIRGRLDSYLENPCKILTFDGDVEVRFETSALPQSNLIGTIFQNKSKCKSQWTGSLSLAEAAKQIVTPVKDRRLDYFSYKMGSVENEIFIVKQKSNTIHKMSTDGEEKGIIQVENVGNLGSIIHVNNKVIISSANGVYEIDASGTVRDKIASGSFCDLSFTNNKMFALDDGNGEVLVALLDNNKRSFNLDGKLKIAAYKQNWINTIQSTRTSVYIALRNSHTILQYKHDGRLVSTFEPSKPVGLQKLYWPYVCCADDDGALLIVNNGTNSLIVLQPDGNMTTLQVPKLSCPYSALVLGNSLIVTQGNYPNLRIYTFES